MFLFRSCQTACNVCEAVTETITTPTPGIGHGRAGDVVAIAMCALSLIGVL